MRHAIIVAVLTVAAISHGAGHAAALPLCGAGKRVTCVVDGDTLWLGGEKIRLDGIDAPETDGRCQAERMLARRATLALSGLLAGKAIDLRRTGTDRYGRTLAKVLADGRDVGEQMLREGLARPWAGRRESWCGD